MTTVGRKHFLLHAIAPVLLGAIIYYIFFPETEFVGMVDSLLGVSFHIPVKAEGALLRGIRFYLPDLLWAYSLMSALALVIGCNMRAAACAAVFEILMEGSQCLQSVRGTFDICDIAVELLADIIVIFLFRRELSNEKD